MLGYQGKEKRRASSQSKILVFLSIARLSSISLGNSRNGNVLTDSSHFYISSILYIFVLASDNLLISSILIW